MADLGVLKIVILHLETVVSLEYGLVVFLEQFKL